ncbi:MAG: riboflavin biosynthesis protein RibF [Bacilli bacterium]|nr:riboflavin biosynthesis protein RibF [Bacilli bacterium]MBQ8472090.1 riboflavin biosynthesis protein RibF [Bacilli bacterium]
MEIKKIVFNPNLDINKDVALTIGEFDGIHLAHYKLLKQTLDIAGKENCLSAVMTFDPHPDIVIKHLDNFQSIYDLDTKIEKIKDMGFDLMYLVSFDQKFARLEHDVFEEEVLKCLCVKHVIVGDDFHYGYKGLGNYKTLENKFKVSVMPQMVIDNQKISSTYIKELLNNGKIKEANYLLGECFKMKTEVIHGRKVGNTINVPTANLQLMANYPSLKRGVYVVKCYFDEQEYLGICNIGHNPSFNYYENLSYEVHIIEDGFNKDLYGQKIDVSFIDYLREEIKFGSIEEFKKQIENDKKQAFMIVNNRL